MLVNWLYEVSWQQLNECDDRIWLSDNILVFFPGPTLPTKCALLIGHSFDAAVISRYFVGILDEVIYVVQYVGVRWK
jgi:hypothetical protein